MKKLLLLIIVLLFLNGCSTLYVETTLNHNVKPSVKKEMIKNEKERRIERRKIKKIYRKQFNIITKEQNESWK